MRNSRSNNGLITTIHLIAILPLLLLFFTAPKGADEVIIWPCLIIFYVIFYRSYKRPVKINNTSSFIKIDLLFLIFYYIIYYLPYQGYILGLNTLNTKLKFDPYIQYSDMSMLASTIGLLAFSAGYTRIQRIKIDQKTLSVDAKLPNKYLNRLLLTIVICTVVCLGVFSSSAGKLVVGSYSGSSTGDKDADGVFFLTTFFVMLLEGAAIFNYKNYGRLTRPLILISVAIAIGWSVFLLILGDRNTFFLVAIVAIGGYYAIIKSISRMRIFVLLVGALLLYQVVAISRTAKERSFDAIIESFNNSDSYDANSLVGEESSFTTTTVGARAGFYLVPNREDYYYGKFKALGILGVIPYSRAFIVDPNDRFISSSKVLGYYLLGSNATWGVGSNIVTDIYFDFGILGVIALMYIVGWFARYFQNKVLVNPNSIKWTTIYLLAIALIAEMPRYTFDFPVRNLAWAFLFFSVFDFFMKPRILRRRYKF
ncbi:oligosaccharide repeat unit polymerase [Mucilaginibacter terrigena]|uniref:Oligosaccharide repeat unit polymerase n=1 Tax=Mucilaginibacter terrigena TaxID=2492395 RepID=A0A4Q5LMJ1_9SPHI|nr:O-antigen polymerase [Mucilaginibacter terrigena]RYU90222.1 oligosaccharide repeat unit polymerase [Mucilaginibacter terrigena]